MAKKETATTPKTLEEALEVITNLGVTIENLKSENEELTELLAEARKESAGKQAPEFTINKKTYRITAGKFNFEGKHYTASELVENKDLQAQLVEIGAGFIEEVTE